MRDRSIIVAALLGGAVSAGLAVLFALGRALAGVPSAPYLTFEWIARLLPGRLVSFGIDSMIRVVTVLGAGSTDQAAKAAEKAMAVALFVVLGGLVGAGLAAAGRG